MTLVFKAVMAPEGARIRTFCTIMPVYELPSINKINIQHFPLARKKPAHRNRFFEVKRETHANNKISQHRLASSSTGRRAFSFVLIDGCRWQLLQKCLCSQLLIT